MAKTGGALGILLGSIALVQGQTPINDDFESATLLGDPLPLAVVGSNIGGSIQPDEPDHYGQERGASVWWRWVTPVDGTYRLDTVGSDFDTVLVVYEGASLPALSPVASDDDSGEGVTSALEFQAAAGTIYSITVAGFSDRNTGEISLQIYAPEPPPNDEFSSAAALDAAVPVEVFLRNFDKATVEAGEPDGALGSPGAGTAWWSWTPGSDATIAFVARQNYMNPRIEVFTGGTLASLQVAGSSANGFATLDVSAGTTYSIRVAGNQANPMIAPLGLLVREFAPPSNDDLADAVDLGMAAVPFTASGSIVDASVEDGEPEGYGSGTVWWTWTAPETATVQIAGSGIEEDGFFSMYGVSPFVFTGTSIGDLQPVAGSPYQRYLYFKAVQGQRYYLRAWSTADSIASATLAVAAGPPPPANDLFEGAEELAGLPSPVVEGTLLGALLEDGDPQLTPFANGLLGNLWYRWTAPTSSPAALHVTSDNYLGILSKAYTGTGLDDLSPVATSDSDVFDAVGGTVYYFLVEGTVMDQDAEESAFSIKVVPPPDNDSFDNRRVITGTLPLFEPGTTVGAGREPDEEATPMRSVWFEWTPAASGKVTLALQRQGMGTISPSISVFTGDNLATLAVAGGFQPATGGGLGTLDALAGTNYKIRVGGDSAADFLLGIAEPPPNDLLAAAVETLGSGQVLFQGDLVGSTFEMDEPDYARQSIWWRWTAPETAEMTFFGTFDSPAAAAEELRVEIYEGSAVDNLTYLGGTRKGRSSIFDAVAGTEYLVRANSRDSIVANGAVTVSLFCPPLHDGFGDPGTIVNSGFDAAMVAGHNVAASREDDEPSRGEKFLPKRLVGSVWWEWVAPSDELVSIDTAGSEMDTVLHVYMGDALGTLDRIRGCDDADVDGTSRVAFYPQTGATYHIRVAGTGERASGAYSLTLRQHPAPATAANYLLHGLAHLEGGGDADLAAAVGHFEDAVAAAPGNMEAKLLRAVTKLALLQQSTEFSTLVTGWGFATKRTNLTTPRYLPNRDGSGAADLPGGASVRQALDFSNATLIPALAEYEADLAMITDTGFELKLSDAESRMRFMKVDWADAQVLRAIGFAMKALVHFGNTWNVNFDVEDLVDLHDGKSLDTEMLLSIGAQFLKREVPDERVQAKAAIQTADTLYQPAYASMTARPPTDGDAHLFYIPAGKESRSDERAEDIADMAASLNGTVTWDGVDIDLSALLDSTVPLRDLMPLMKRNKAIASSAPDPSMDGVVLAGTHAALNTFLSNNRLLHDVSSFLAYVGSYLGDQAAEVRTKNADFDRDGLSNFFEWVFNLDPTRPNTDKDFRVAGVIEDPANPGQQHLALTFIRLKGIAELDYKVLVSDDLKDWDDTGLQIEQVGPAVTRPDGVSEEVTYRVVQPVGAFAGKYLKIEVVEQ